MVAVSQNITLVPLELAAETPNPNLIDLDLKRRLLFAATRVDRFAGEPGGAASAFSIDAATGKLTLINQTPCKGVGPCYLALDDAGRNVLVANYDSGSVAVLPVAPDGKFGEATDFVQHAGKSVNPERQNGPHEQAWRRIAAHSVSSQRPLCLCSETNSIPRSPRSPATLKPAR